MNNVISLVKISLGMSLRGQVGKRRKIKTPLIILGIIIWMGSLLWPFSELVKAMYGTFEAFGQGDAIIVIGLLIASMVVFIFGIFYTISSYYMAKDIPTYLYMPLKPWEISAARFIIVLLYEYLTMLIFFLPMIIGYGSAVGAGVVYYLISAVVFLLLPVLPLVLASAIIIAIMSFAKKAMNKDRYTMIASLLGLCIGIGFNIGFQRLAGMADNQEGLQEMLVSGRLSLAENIARYFPGLPNAAKALVDGNILHLILFILIAAGAFAVFLLIAKALYFKGVIGIGQTVSRRDFDAEKSNGFKVSSPIKVYFTKEIKLIFRTPIYFMNLALMDIIMPAVLIIPMLSMGPDTLNELKSMLLNTPNTGIYVGGAFVLFSFISAMNGITATTISREGSQFAMLKYLPISYGDQLKAKLMSGMVVSFAGLVITLTVISILIGIELPVILLMLLAGLNAVVLTRITGLFIDAANPKLNWDNEVKAVKQNMNLVINMLVGIAAAGLAVVLMIFVTKTLIWSIVLFIGGFAVINIGLFKLLENRFPKMLAKIE